MRSYSPDAMRARAHAANDGIVARLSSLWKPTTFERFDGSYVLCSTYGEWEAEIDRYGRDSGGFAPPC